MSHSIDLPPRLWSNVHNIQMYFDSWEQKQKSMSWRQCRRTSSYSNCYADVSIAAFSIDAGVVSKCLIKDERMPWLSWTCSRTQCFIFCLTDAILWGERNVCLLMAFYSGFFLLQWRISAQFLSIQFAMHRNVACTISCGSGLIIFNV